MFSKSCVLQSLLIARYDSEVKSTDRLNCGKSTAGALQGEYRIITAHFNNLQCYKYLFLPGLDGMSLFTTLSKRWIFKILFISYCVNLM